MAFEKGLGHDPSQPPEIAQDFTVSATGLVSRTISLWTRKLVQYIIIVGIVGAGLTLISFVMLFELFGTIGVLGTDPISYVFSIFTLTTIPDLTLIGVAIMFAIIAFGINAIVAGTAIKFALDDYGERRGDIGRSFSHSFKRTLNIILVQLLLSFLVSVVTTPGLILTSMAMEGIDISDPFNPIFPPGSLELMMQAFGLIIVGGIFLIYISARFAPTLAIVIDTDLSAIDSLKKSWELTSGNVLHVLAAQFLIIIVILVLDLIVNLGLTSVLYLSPYVIVVEVIISTLLFSSLNFIFYAVLYRDLISRTGISDLPDFVW